MKTFNQKINDINKARAKIYYNLSELENIIGLSIRALKYRMLTVKQKYVGVPVLLSKENSEWRIHYSIIDEFQPKYKLKKKTIYNLDWKSFGTWNPKFQHDDEFHEMLLSEVKCQLHDKMLMYAVEKDERGINHIHFVTDADTSELTAAIEKTFKHYMLTDEKEYHIEVEPVYRKYCAIEYLRKAPVSIGIMEGSTPLGGIVPQGIPLVTRHTR